MTKLYEYKLIELTNEDPIDMEEMNRLGEGGFRMLPIGPLGSRGKVFMEREYQSGPVVPDVLPKSAREPNQEPEVDSSELMISVEGNHDGNTIQVTVLRGDDVVVSTKVSQRTYQNTVVEIAATKDWTRLIKFLTQYDESGIL